MLPALPTKMSKLFLCLILHVLYVTFTSSNSTTTSTISTTSNPAKERTLILIRPDGEKNEVVKMITKRFKDKGFRLIKKKVVEKAEAALLKKHYVKYKDTDFIDALVQLMSSGPLVPMVWQGLNVINVTNSLLHQIEPEGYEERTIREEKCMQSGRTVIYSSDSVASAQRDIPLWFKREETDPAFKYENLWNETFGR